VTGKLKETTASNSLNDEEIQIDERRDSSELSEVELKRRCFDGILQFLGLLVVLLATRIRQMVLVHK